MGPSAPSFVIAKAPRLKQKPRLTWPPPAAILPPAMKTLCTAAVIIAAVACAADPGPGRTSGRILILANDRILEGDVTRRGDQYCIRRSIGETWIEGSQVVRLCADLDDALNYLRTQANLRDPDERLRLARWCQLHGLRKPALDEVRAAVELRPTHAEGRRLLQCLEKSVAAREAAPVQPPAEAEPASAPAALPAVEVTNEAMSLFTTRVQPILMNACASCHALGRGGSFKLTRTFEGTINRRVLQENLAAALGQLNPEHPSASALLVKAVTVHGDSTQPPLKNRQIPAFKALEDWVKLAVPDKAWTTETPTLAKPSDTATKTDSSFAASAPLPTAKPAEPTAKPAQDTTAAPPDAFDPAAFNKLAHPDAKDGK